jgi:hypothetical protein
MIFFLGQIGVLGTMSSGSKERKESEQTSIIDVSPSTESAKPKPAPNYFGQLPAPQRGGGEEESLVETPPSFPCTNRGNAWRLNEIRMVSCRI